MVFNSFGTGRRRADHRRNIPSPASKQAKLCKALLSASSYVFWHIQNRRAEPFLRCRSAENGHGKSSSYPHPPPFSLLPLGRRVFRTDLCCKLHTPRRSRGMLSKALELWAFRVPTLCKSIQAKAFRVVSRDGRFGEVGFFSFYGPAVWLEVIECPAIMFKL